MRLLKILPSLTLALLIAVSSGCGPGFPILTGEQESLIQNVDRLLKENEALKKRVSALEGGGGDNAAQLRKDVEELKKKVADANSSLESLRQEFSFVQGSTEENDRQKEQIKEGLKSVNASFASINDRLLALENGAKDTSSKIEALKSSSDANDKRWSEALATVEKRTSTLESRVQAVEAQPASAIKKEEKAEKAQKPDPEEVYLKGYRETIDKDYAKATETFQGFLSEYPNHKFAGNAHYWLGEIYYARGDWERAIIEFDRVIKKYPKSEKVAASLLKEGFSFEKIGSDKEAKVLLKEVMEKYPNSPEAGLAKKRLRAMR